MLLCHAHTLSVLTFLSLSIQTGITEVPNVDNNTGGQCLEPEQFECKWFDESVCLNKTTKQCNGEVDCDDASDESPSVCLSCEDDTGIFVCEYEGHTVCLNKTTQQCNGIGVCDDGSDEFTSQCGECLDSDKFECTWYGERACLNKKV